MTTKASPELLAALETIRKNRAGLEEYMEELNLISKAERVDDHWETVEGDHVATREEVKVGPTQRASGGGAEKMVREYSHPARQSGITMEAEKLARMLAPVASSMKALADGMNLIAASQSAMMEAIKAMSSAAPAVAVKADNEKKVDNEDDDMMKAQAKEACTKSVTRAQLLIKKANALADAADVEMDSMKSATMKSEAAELRVKARAEVTKANALLTLGVTDAELVKSVGELSKADMDGDKKDKEAREAAESEARKSANQADKKDEATGNQDDSTVKATADLTALKAQVDAALNGITTLSATVGDVMKHISNGARRSPPGIPAAAKAAGSGDPIAKALDTYRTALEGSGMDQADRLGAESILSYVGHVNPEIIKARISRASDVVQNFFEGFEPPAVEAVA